MTDTKIEKLKRKKQEIEKQLKAEKKKERDKIAKSLGLKIMRLYRIDTRTEAIELFKKLEKQKKGLKL